LARLADRLEAGELEPDTVQATLHGLKAELGLSAQEAFGAVYVAFLGKSSGPQAGAMLAALGREFVVRRLREASGRQPVRYAP
ncbi:MAG: lysine--tRNA ligase, partial [Armatimonadota bacterium]|nr:lysine--tRNA ligase [Armatimonadota bacterium]